MGLIPFITSNWRLIAVGLLGLALGIQTVRLHDARTELAEEVAAHAQERAALAERARFATQKLSDQKAAHAAEQQEIVHAYHKEKEARRAAETGAAAADQRLRNDIRAFTGGERPGTDAAAGRSERDRAATLGLLLEDAVGFSGSLAQAAEQHAGEVRFLKRVIENDRAGCKPLPDGE
jgi:hypothetical protein